MYPLLFQETYSIENMAIGVLSGASLSPLPFFLSLLSHFIWVLVFFIYTDHTHTSVTSSPHTLSSFSPIGFGFCVSGYHSFTHTYCASFTIIFISVLPVSPTGFTGCFIGFWFMIFIMSPFSLTFTHVILLT